jgi:hypothetical protein
MKKVVKKPAAKMQDGGKIKIKIKVKPDRKQAREDKDKMSLIKDSEMSLKKPSMKKGGSVKAKSGGSFPDLNKDGKVTKADVLVGRGVIKAKKGKSVKKAQLGGLVDKLAGGMGKKAGGFSGIKDMFGNSGFGGRGLMGAIGGLLAKRKKQASAAPAEGQSTMKKGGKLKKQAATAIAMKKAGKKPKTMKSGGKMGKCRYGCN